MSRTKNASINDHEEGVASKPQQPYLPPPVDFDRDFCNADYAILWPKFQSRAIVTGRSVMLEDSEHRILLSDFVLGMGWGPLIYLEDKVYPLKVRLFYTNLTVRHRRDEPVLRSHIHGKMVMIDRTLLRVMLELNEGDSRIHFTTDEHLRLAGDNIHEDTGLIRIMRKVCVSRNTPRNIVKSDLHPKLHILHLWIRHNVSPTKGHFDTVMPFQVFIMYCFLEGIILDLPTIILHEMIQIRESDRRALGFGALLNTVFKMSGIDLTTEVPCECQVPIDRYMIERSHVLELLTERVIEAGRSALPTQDVFQGGDIAMTDAQPTAAPYASAATSSVASAFASTSELCRKPSLVLSNSPSPRTKGNKGKEKKSKVAAKV